MSALILGNKPYDHLLSKEVRKGKKLQQEVEEDIELPLLTSIDERVIH